MTGPPSAPKPPDAPWRHRFAKRTHRRAYRQVTFLGRAGGIVRTWADLEPAGALMPEHDRP